ncbi:cysteine desulfurase NifS [Dethiobacter alkaliphilus]|uniref:Cysteine desulfurase IscS n=1 Tax=Dethiobacter alkaliphilus AHT 1 TaxID=555088 RepID=C0GCR2_DETAL|nr:cysteine desulfurase NifS [Dethiobacter alkaliphilus]EEG78997.1 cysteine desulfurase NifS [Dethiobacter alkaliphilus AHT 1]
MKKIYLDHGATTKMNPEVLETMMPYMTEIYGNPSSIHFFGREVRKAVEEAREKVAAAIGAQPREIIFTSGGTESDNLAIRGVARALRKKGNHIITSAVEHHAVIDTCNALKDEGFEVTAVPVDEHGMVNVKDVEAAITDQTILITIMMANNEVGTIMPVAEIGKLAKERGITFHTDAVQAIGSLPVNVEEINCDLLSMSAHKFYGPKGVGALYVRKGTKLKVYNFGGAQERKMRPGTENVPGIIGMGKAIELAVTDLEQKTEQVRKLRDKLIDGLMQIEDTKLNGHPQERLPGSVNVSIQYVEGESLILSLDLKGIAASSGSACTSGSLDPSHVLMAMGLDHQTAHGSLRLTLGRDNTEEEIDYVLEVIPEVVERLRSMSPVYACKSEN